MCGGASARRSRSPSSTRPTPAPIDVVAKAGKELREAVARAFVEELFPADADAEFEPVRLQELDLSGLALQTSFPVDPEDGIASVRLVLLRFSARRDGRPRHARDRRQVTSLPQRGGAGLVRGNNPLRQRPRITKAKLAIGFAPRPGQRRGRTLPVELTWPYGCNLRDRSDQERLVGEKNLRRWNLVRDV